MSLLAAFGHGAVISDALFMTTVGSSQVEVVWAEAGSSYSRAMSRASRTRDSGLGGWLAFSHAVVRDEALSLSGPLRDTTPVREGMCRSCLWLA